jgi:predicted MFS family arabinose efflux permease
MKKLVTLLIVGCAVLLGIWLIGQMTEREPARTFDGLLFEDATATITPAATNTAIPATATNTATVTPTMTIAASATITPTLPPTFTPTATGVYGTRTPLPDNTPDATRTPLVEGSPTSPAGSGTGED